MATVTAAVCPLASGIYYYFFFFFFGASALPFGAAEWGAFGRAGDSTPLTPLILWGPGVCPWWEGATAPEPACFRLDWCPFGWSGFGRWRVPCFGWCFAFPGCCWRCRWTFVPPVATPAGSPPPVPWSTSPCSWEVSWSTVPWSPPRSDWSWDTSDASWAPTCSAAVRPVWSGVGWVCWPAPVEPRPAKYLYSRNSTTAPPAP